MTTQAPPSKSLLFVVSCGGSADAWPIELGWSTGGSAPCTMKLRPASSWALTAWDKGFEAQHQIALETLLAEGKSPLDACLILNAALVGHQVHSAVPEQDSYWLYKLYRAAGTEPNYRLVQGAPRKETPRSLGQVRGAGGGQDCTPRGAPTIMRAAEGLELLRAQIPASGAC